MDTKQTSDQTQEAESYAYADNGKNQETTQFTLTHIKLKNSITSTTGSRV